MATTTLKTSTLPREFVFNGSRIPDPDPQMSIDPLDQSDIRGSEPHNHDPCCCWLCPRIGLRRSFVGLSLFFHSLESFLILLLLLLDRCYRLATSPCPLIVLREKVARRAKGLEERLALYAPDDRMLGPFFPSTTF